MGVLVGCLVVSLFLVEHGFQFGIGGGGVSVADGLALRVHVFSDGGVEEIVPGYRNAYQK